MLYYNGKWYDFGKEVTIISQDDTFTKFSNGDSFMTFEIKNKIKNYNTYPAEQLKAKRQYMSRFNR